MRSARLGFSLVELSIVLVILGLLTGGILAGQSLIRASELRAVNTEFQRYITAMGSFRDKYFAIPGDFTKASGTGGFGWTDAGAVAAEVGSGNGSLDQTAAVGTNEISGFWVHLASAGLIEGSYTGIAGVTMTAGINNPRSKMTSAAWNVISLGSVSVAGVLSPDVQATDPAASTFYAGTYGVALLLGAGTSAVLPTGVLKSEEAWNIDTKMDDGLPDQGSVRTLESQGSVTPGAGCGNLATATTALAASAYDLTNTSSTACSLVIKTGY
jgi:prepilin-type N-terminal cleavage/methylation domain-containing protein